MTRCVAFVGPLPPPVHGFSNVCAQVLQLFSAKSAVEIFDRTPRTTNLLLSRIAQLLQPFRYVGWCLWNRELSLYLALSGGWGQVFDWPYVIIAKVFHSRIFIHHHSFAYLNSPSLLNKVCFALVRHDTHIVLSEGMRSALTNTYHIDSDCVQVVSNAAFYPPAQMHAKTEANSASPICVGFLSNVTFEKGFIEFFEVLSQLKKRGVACQALIAGPVGAEASERYCQLLASSPDTASLGPIYGDSKDRFYERLDLFLFPTRYANEAEPLVILEALRSGVYVIASDRGAIAEVLGNGAGVVFRDDFVNGAVMHIERLTHNRAQLRVDQRLAQEQFQRIRDVAHMAIASLLTEIFGIID